MANAKLWKLQQRKIQLIRRIALLREHQRKLVEFVGGVEREYQQGWLTREQQQDKLVSVLQGVKPWQWMQHMQKNIGLHERELVACEQELARTESSKFVPVLMIAFILLVAGLGIWLFQPTLTGLTIFQNESIGNETLVAFTAQAEEVYSHAEINQAVRWSKVIRKNASGFDVELPRYASNITIINLDTGKQITVQEKSAGYGIAAFSENRTLLVENATAVNVSYETPAPVAVERNLSEYKKEIIISSDIHYENIFTYTTLPREAPREAVHLYWMVNGSRQEVVEVQYEDEDSDGLIEWIGWWTPSLSNQTYEVEIIILNVQSYPEVGGIWQVNFTTIGKANLTIRAVDNTTFEDYINATEDDLEFLELRCGDNVLTTTLTNGEVFWQDYECNATGSETSRVLTPGVHTLEFEFGGIKVYAHNQAVIVEYGIAGDIDMIVINTTHFVLAYVNTSANRTQYKVMDTAGNVLAKNDSVMSNVGNKSRVALGRINNTHFMMYLLNQTSDPRVLINVNGTTVPGGNHSLKPYDNAVGTNTFLYDNGVASFGNLTFHCYIDTIEADFDAVFFDGGGRMTAAREDIDATNTQALNLSNVVDCYAMNYTTAGLIWIDQSAADITFNIIDITNTLKIADVDFDISAGTNPAVAITTINNQLFVALWMDSAETDVTFALRDGGGLAVLNPVDIDTFAGTTTRLDVAAVANGSSQGDHFVAVYNSQGLITAKIFNTTNETASFSVEGTIQADYRLLSVLGKDPVSNASLCDGKFVVAYNNASNHFTFKTFGMNGSEISYTGCMQVALSFNAATAANNTNTSVKSIYTNVTLTTPFEKNITFLLMNTTGVVNETTFPGTVREFNHTSTQLNNVTHYFNITVCDIYHVCNTSETRKIGIDDVSPTLYEPRINATSNVALDTIVTVNASITDESLMNVTLEVDPPLSAAFNVTPSRSGANFTNTTVKLDQIGQWRFRFYANDTAGNNATRFAADGAGNLFIEVASANTAPTVRNVSVQAAIGPVEASFRWIGVTFNVSDLDGAGDINLSRAFVQLNYSGEPSVRSNGTCVPWKNDTVNTYMFNCSVQMWYFDINGDWTVNVSIYDNASAYAENASSTFTYNTLTAMVMNQTALRWPSLLNGAVNQTSNNDAEALNNTGNVNISVGGITITGYNLKAETVPNTFFNITNFTVSWNTGGGACSGSGCSECVEATGNTTRNATSRVINVANLSRGNNTAGNGQESLYFCIQTVPQLPKDSYFSNASNWQIAVT